MEFTKFKTFSLYLFGLCCGFFCALLATDEILWEAYIWLEHCIVIIFWQCKLCPFMIYYPGTSIYKLHSTSRLRGLQDFASSNIWGFSVFVLHKQCQPLKSAPISHDLHGHLVWWMYIKLYRFKIIDASMTKCFGFESRENSISHLIRGIDCYYVKYLLTHLSQSKMAAILQMIFTDAFSWMKSFNILLKISLTCLPWITYLYTYILMIYLDIYKCLVFYLLYLNLSNSHNFL